jgi:hypothetical protein
MLFIVNQSPETINGPNEENEMGFKRKPMLTRQTADVEQSLQIRLTYLSGKGLAAAKVEKDPLIRKLRAEIRTLKSRIRAIDNTGKRMEEKAKAKADKAAAALKADEPEAPKAEKPKKGGEEGKEKKPKGEKKAGSEKAPEGGKKPKAKPAA